MLVRRLMHCGRREEGHEGRRERQPEGDEHFEQDLRDFEVVARQVGELRQRLLIL